MVNIPSQTVRTRGFLWLLVVVGSLLNGGRCLAGDLVFWGPGYLDDARAVAIAPNGEIWVGSSARLTVFNADGTFNRVDNRFKDQINSIAFDAQGQPIIGSNSGTVLWYEGAEAKSFGGFGQYAPWEVAVDDEGSIYATDGGNSVIKKFNKLGVLLQVYRVQATGKDPDPEAEGDAKLRALPLVRPYGLALDARRRLFVTDERKRGLWVFNNDGSFARMALETQQCWRVRRGPDGMYVVTDNDIVVLDPETLQIARRIPAPAGYRDAMGFAVGADGSLYCGNFTGGIVKRLAPNGNAAQVLGPTYKATVSVPDNWTPGQTVAVPLKIEKIATNPVGKVPPVFTMALQPAALVGEPDSNWANAEQGRPDAAWQVRRQAQFAAQERALPAEQGDATLIVSVPGDVPTNLYRLIVRADTGFAAKDATQASGDTAREQPIGMLRPEAGAGLTLYIPRQRSVFQHGEVIEISAIIRSRDALPAGTLRVALARRASEALAWQGGVPEWKQFPVAALTNGTLTLLADAAAIHPGRYVLQCEYSAGNQVLRDVWPLQIVADVPPTRFRILFPEWSAGYTHIWGPFTGQGMRADSELLAREGIVLYDTTILHRGADPALQPVGADAGAAAPLIAQAATSPALPAPERFMAAAPLEIELQEALRNGLQVQRDIWGSHFLENWGMAHPLGVARDNRIVKMWTQWQREWPSWIGHRYLTLSIDEGNNPERVALMDELKARGLTLPTEAELTWARNGAQRNFISDAPVPVSQTLGAAAAAPDGSVYVGAIGGTLLKYSPDGKLLWKTQVPGGVLDLQVAPDGTVWGANDGTFSRTTPDGKTTSFPATGFGNYAPRGIWLEPGGATVLLNDQAQSRIRRFTVDGQFVADIGDKNTLQTPSSQAVLSDGTIYVADAGKGGLMIFKADGSPVKFLAGIGSQSPGGKLDIWAGPDDTLWVTEGWGGISHVDRDGKRLGTVGHSTFAIGGLSLPMSISLTPRGNLLVADVALPYVQELTPAGDPIRAFGLGKLFADVRLDRARYTMAERMVATVWMPIPGQGGEAASTLQAFWRLAPTAAWQPLAVEAFSGGDFSVAVPQLEGKVVVRLVWAPPGADGDSPLHADFTVEVTRETSAADQTKLSDIIGRQVAWKEAWSRRRMGTLVRWTELSDRIRPGTQNTAPTNYGTPDNLAEGVWVPYRRAAVVAEAENEGHDHGSYPLMGPWYVARALEGPEPKPAWSSLLQWYWDNEKSYARPLRDTVVLLGAGASGIGPGKLAATMNDGQRALLRKTVDRLRRLGEATMALDLPGQGGVAVLHSFTQESMDPYNEEHFYTAHAAWYDLLRAHVPTAVVSEEEIVRGGLNGRFKAVLLPCVQYPLPAATLAALEAFRKAGGEVWVDLATRTTIPGATIPGAKTLRTRYRPFWIQDAYYWIHNGYGVGAYDGNYEYWRMRQGSDGRLPAVREAFGKLATIPVNTDDADVFVQQRTGGQGIYVFASNDRYPDTPLYKSRLAFDTPAPKTVNFKLPAGGAVYDVLSSRLVARGNGTLKVEFTSTEPARVWAVLPQPIAAVDLRSSLLDGELFATIVARNALAQPIAAAVPLEIVITDGAGREQYHLWRSTASNGVCRLKVPVGWMAPGGKWTVTARELLGMSVARPVFIDVTSKPAAINLSTAPALLFDREAIAATLKAMEGQEVWIALGKEQEALRAAAGELATSLTGRGVKAKVVNIADLPELAVKLDYKMTDDNSEKLERVRAGEAVARRSSRVDFREPGPDRLVMRPLILLGDPAQNPWLADIDGARLLRRSLSPSYPGPGRALVQQAWSPFYDGYDAITIMARDEGGVRAGIAALLK